MGQQKNMYMFVGGAMRLPSEAVLQNMYYN